MLSKRDFNTMVTIPYTRQERNRKAKKKREVSKKCRNIGATHWNCKARQDEKPDHDVENKVKRGKLLLKLLKVRSLVLSMALWTKEDKTKQFPRFYHFSDNLRDGFFTIFSPREAVTKLRISKFMKPSCSSNTEIAPDILIAAEIQFLNCTRTGLKSL